MTDQKMFAIVKDGKYFSDACSTESRAWTDFSDRASMKELSINYMLTQFVREKEQEGYTCQPVTVSLESGKDCRLCENILFCQGYADYGADAGPVCKNGDMFKPSHKIQLWSK